MATARAKAPSLLDRELWGPALVESFRKLSPRLVAKNPVMFVVEVGAVLTTAVLLRDLLGRASGVPTWFTANVTLWLWFTVVFANFAEAVAEGRGKAQADALRRMRRETIASRIMDGGQVQDVPASTLRKGEIVEVRAGMLIPADGEIVEGIASVDESAITG
ncbi:MAG TPA: potassium-transporting ATPase subunit B, partial [Myxococcota bacterium]|nr:potassium-transporting ATPase subunit B [Myxococcota bacterium]